MKMKFADVRKELRLLENDLTHATIGYVALQPSSMADAMERMNIAKRIVEMEARVQELREMYPKAIQGPKA